MNSELERDRYWRYQRQVSPGLQEYIEALSFTHYLDHGNLITFEQAQETLCDVSGKPVSNCIDFRLSRQLINHVVLPIDGLRLFTWRVRPDGRAYALCHIWDC